MNRVDRVLAGAFGGEGGLVAFKVVIYSMALAAVLHLDSGWDRLAVLVGMTFSMLAGLGYAVRTTSSSRTRSRSEQSDERATL